MPMKSGEHRIVRRGHDGLERQYSNATERPSGSGWVKVDKSQHPRVRSYIWVRDAANIISDKAARAKVAEEKPSLPSLVAKFFDPREYMAKYHEYQRSKQLDQFKTGDRVNLNGSIYYVKRIDREDGNVVIKNAIFGEEKSVDAAELELAKPIEVDYPENTKVSIAKGVLDPRKEVEADVVGRSANGKYRVTIDGGKTVVDVYPEGINASIPEKEDVKVVDNRLLSQPNLFVDPGQQRILRIVGKASRDKRTSVTLKEVRQQLEAEGHPISEFYILHAFHDLGAVQPNIQFNSATGVLTIGTGDKSIEHILKYRNIGLDNMPDTKNLVGESKTEMYGYVGQEVRSTDASFAAGIIDKIAGKNIFIKTADKRVVKTTLSNLYDALTRKQLLANPANPETFGSLRHKDAWWILRDREHCKEIQPGESVTFIPGTTKFAQTGDKQSQRRGTNVAGRVVSSNTDGTVTVDMEEAKGKFRRVVVSPRQLMLNRKFTSFPQLQEYIQFRPSLTHNRTFYVDQTKVEIGGKGSKEEGRKSVAITFANGEDLAEHEHLYFQPITNNAATGGGTSYLQMVGKWISGSNGQTCGPSKELVSILRRIYPSAKTISIKRDTNLPNPRDLAAVGQEIKMTITVDAKTGELYGKSLDMGRVMEELSEKSAEEKGRMIRASEVSDYNSIRMEKDENNLYIRLGERFSKFTGDLPPLPTIREEKKQIVLTGEAPEGGETATQRFKGIVEATEYAKKTRWGHLGKELLDEASVFTYDKENDRYVVDLENYRKAKGFIRRFFGDIIFSNNVYETDDGGYYTRAPDDLLLPHVKESMDAAATLEQLLKDIKPLPDLNPANGFFMDLRPYQNKAVRFATSRDTSLLAMDQGTGKTAAAIGAITKRFNDWEEAEKAAANDRLVVPLKRRALIVAPASVAKTSWMKDLAESLGQGNKKAKYGFTLLMGNEREAGYKALADPAAKRDKDGNPPVQIAVTSYETFREDFKELRSMGFDIAVLDEAQTIKNDMDEESASITASNIKNMLGEVKFKVALTGTPMENKPEDLQSILEFLNPELFGDAHKFRSDFIEVDYLNTHDVRGRPQKRPVAISLKNAKALRTKLDQIMFRITKDQLAVPGEPLAGNNVVSAKELPALYARYKTADADERKRIEDKQVITDRTVFPRVSAENGVLKFDPVYPPITTEGYPEYQGMIEAAKKRLVADIVDAAKKGKQTSWQTVLVRMQQVQNDPSLLAKIYGPEFHSVPNPKVDRLIQHIEENFPGHDLTNEKTPGKIIIFAKYLETIGFLQKTLAERFPGLRVWRFTGQSDKSGSEKDRRKLEKMFNEDPAYPIMLANDAAKTGVNLPAASTVINYDADWNPQDLNQRIDRAHRVRNFGAIMRERHAPARKVTAYTLAVVDAKGDPNYSIESKKMANRLFKEQMFKAIINGETEEAKMQPDNYQAIAEELLNVANTTGANRVDAGEQRRHAEEVAGERRRKQLAKQHGGYLSRYFQ